MDKLFVAAAQAAAVLLLGQLQESHASLLDLNQIHEKLDPTAPSKRFKAG